MREIKRKSKGVVLPTGDFGGLKAGREFLDPAPGINPARLVKLDSSHAMNVLTGAIESYQHGIVVEYFSNRPLLDLKVLRKARSHLMVLHSQTVEHMKKIKENREIKEEKQVSV